MEENKKPNTVTVKQPIEIDSDVIIYSNTGCPYCSNVKEEFENQKIKFEERLTTDFKDEWIDISKLTGIPSVPTIMYKDEYFVPGRDFGNPAGLIQILSNYKPSKFDNERKLLEKLSSLTFHFSQAMNHLSNQMRTLANDITEIKNNINGEKTEEDVDESTN